MQANFSEKRKEVVAVARECSSVSDYARSNPVSHNSTLPLHNLYDLHLIRAPLLLLKRTGPPDPRTP